MFTVKSTREMGVPRALPTAFDAARPGARVHTADGRADLYLVHTGTSAKNA